MHFGSPTQLQALLRQNLCFCKYTRSQSGTAMFALWTMCLVEDCWVVPCCTNKAIAVVARCCWTYTGCRAPKTVRSTVACLASHTKDDMLRSHRVSYGMQDVVPTQLCHVVSYEACMRDSDGQNVDFFQMEDNTENREQLATWRVGYGAFMFVILLGSVCLRMALKAIRAMAKYGKDKDALWGIQAERNSGRSESWNPKPSIQGVENICENMLKWYRHDIVYKWYTQQYCILRNV